MEFVDWFPHYQSIRQRFGYSTQKDQEAANILSKMIKRKALDKKSTAKENCRKTSNRHRIWPWFRKESWAYKKESKIYKNSCKWSSSSSN
jgi:uncharacterized Rossmann fold enzyme